MFIEEYNLTDDEEHPLVVFVDKEKKIHIGRIRKLTPRECWRLQGFTDEQFERVKATGMSDAQLYKQAGNAVTTNVIEALAKYILDIDKENANGTDNQNF